MFWASRNGVKDESMAVMKQPKTDKSPPVLVTVHTFVLFEDRTKTSFT